MNSDEWAAVISYLIDEQYKIFIFVYPVYWGLKIAKKILSSGL